jgi:hypothetical protein
MHISETRAVNIFDIEGNANLIRRIESLTPQSRPLWGKMTVSQMLLHCQKPLDVAEGTLLLKRGIIGFLFGKMAKRDFLKRPQFQKNLPTAPSLKIVDAANFEKEKETLLNQVVRFRETGPGIIKNTKHPFFGEMSIEEWGILQYKHLDHHLNQFGG